jgi:hypothetical protein
MYAIELWLGDHSREAVIAWSDSTTSAILNPAEMVRVGLRSHDYELQEWSTRWESPREHRSTLNPLFAVILFASAAHQSDPRVTANV